MKLTLQHLAGYLPYGLKAQDLRTKEVRTVTLLHFSYNKETVGHNHLICAGLLLSKHLPILHPLSDITRKELELAGFDSYIDYLTYENKGVEWTLKAPFDMVQYLLSKHFDIHGLIENNLAIDINTL